MSVARRYNAFTVSVHEFGAFTINDLAVVAPEKRDLVEFLIAYRRRNCFAILAGMTHGRQ
jgi:hypothetical protein